MLGFISSGPEVSAKCDRENILCDLAQHVELSFTLQFTSFHVTGLDSNTDYLFRVSAANKHGFSEPGLISDRVCTNERRPSLKSGISCFLVGTHGS